MNVADRLGFERGARGEPYEPCPYSREDFAHCFFEGWQRGCERLARDRAIHLVWIYALLIGGMIGGVVEHFWRL